MRITLACAALVSGCATHVPPESQADLFAHADLISGDPAGDDAVYAFTGVRVPTRDGAPGTDDVERALEASADCDGLQDRVLWLDCGEAPCHVYVSGVEMVGPPDWATLSCASPGGLHGTYTGHVSFGGDQMIEAAVYAVAFGAAPAADLDGLGVRFRAADEENDLYEAVLAEAAAVYGP